MCAFDQPRRVYAALDARLRGVRKAKLKTFNEIWGGAVFRIRTMIVCQDRLGTNTRANDWNASVPVFAPPQERDTDTLWLLKTAPRRLYPGGGGGGGGGGPDGSAAAAAGSASSAAAAGSASSAAAAAAAASTDVLNVTSAPTRFGDVSYSLEASRVGVEHVADSDGGRGAPLRLVCNVSLALHGRGAKSTLF